MMPPDDCVKVAQHDMDEAQRNIHWHLTKASNFCVQGLVLGQPFEDEMAAAKEWKLRYDAAARTKSAWTVRAAPVTHT